METKKPLHNVTEIQLIPTNHPINERLDTLTVDSWVSTRLLPVRIHSALTNDSLKTFETK